MSSDSDSSDEGAFRPKNTPDPKDFSLQRGKTLGTLPNLASIQEVNEDGYDYAHHSPTDFQVVGSNGDESFGDMRGGGMRGTIDVSHI